MPIKDKNIRKNLKKLAFEDPKGTLAKSLLIFALIISLVDFGIVCLVRNYGYNMENDFYNNLITLITLTITSPLLLNYMNMYLKNSNDELIYFSDLFKFKKNSFKYLFYFIIIGSICFLITSLISLIGVLGQIINVILTITFSFLFLIITFVFIENDNLSLKKIVEKSFDLIKGHLLEFYGILLSFSLWFVLGLLTIGLLYFWLIPYIIITITYFYRYLKKEKKFKKEICLSNKFIIILFIIILLLLNIISYIIYN